MRNPEEQSRRWFKQAEYDLAQARKVFSAGDFSYACFFAEQASQKALKARLISQGDRFINIHSIAELLKKNSLKEKRFEALVETGKKLDLYYLSSRYPDALPEPAIPYESYTQMDAAEAVDIAEKILELCRKP